MDRQPYAHRVHVGCPVPRILVAGFTGMGIIKGHMFDTLLFSVIGLGGVEDHSKAILSNFGILLY